MDKRLYLSNWAAISSQIKTEANRYNLSQMAKKKRLKLERLGQLRLEGV